MAPSKRRAEQIEDGVEVDVVDSASSNFRASGSKRQRVATLSETRSNVEISLDGGSSRPTTSSVEMEVDGERSRTEGSPDFVDLDTGAGLYASSQLRNARPFQEQYDEVFAALHSEDDEVADQHATQQVRRKQRSRPVLNQAAECGIIESITCVNFMCHAKLEVKLGPLINFIIGHNGSGKSAVLTALTLCLGGKATSTNRGQSLKDFIKQGQESSTLTVKIKNQGPTAFKGHIYGDSIIVERHFTIHGASTFKLKNDQGKIVSTKRAELDDLMDSYALQLDNPVNVLTQDMARQFLSNSSANDKYKLFVKGVQLEQLDHDYNLVSQSINAAEARLITIKDDVQVLEKRNELAGEKFNRVKKLDSTRERARVLERQMIWSQVEAQEKELNAVEDRLKDQERNVENKKRAAVNISKDLENLDDSVETIRLALSEKESEDKPLQEGVDVAKDARARAKEAVEEIITEQRDAHSAVQADETRLNTVKSKLDEERRRLEAVDDGSTTDKLAELEDAEQALRERKAELEEHQSGQRLESLRKDESDSKIKASSMGQLVDEKRSALDSATSRLTGLKSTKTGTQQWPLPNMPDLIRAIERETRFKEKPVGPACHHTRLLKPQWSSIVERFFGRSLNAFVVANKHDSTLLLDLSRRTNCDIPVMIAQPGQFDTTQTAPDPSLATVERILEIDSDLVRNMFMAQHGIDQCLLVEDSNEAAQIMFNERPRNVKRCISMHPMKRGWGMSYTFNMFNDEKIEPVNPWNGASRMKTDLEVQIRLQQETVHAQKQELHAAEMSQKEATSHLTKCRQAMLKYDKDKKMLETQCDRADDFVSQLKEELEALRPQEGMLEALKQELAEAEHARQVNGSQLDQINQRRNELYEDLQRKEAAHSTAAKELQAKLKEKERVSNRLSKTLEQRTKTLREKNEALASVEDAEKEKEAAERAVTFQKDVVAEFTQKGEEFCGRVPVGRGETLQTLEEKHKRIRADLERHETAIGGSKEQLWRALQASKKALSLAKMHQFRLADLVRQLTETLFDRIKRWKRFQSEISARARAEFKFLLAKREFRGALEFRHADKELEILVEPDNSRRDANGRQTKTLSGGEKSFSTICMLLALWNAMGSPIRCLDEFDVYMDSANRDVSTEMLIAAARESVGRQFILITPQAMGNVSAAEDVKIIRLNDPERGQTALDFTAS